MNWLKRKIIKWVNEDTVRPEWGDVSGKSNGMSVDFHVRSVPDSAPALSFRIYSAQNGDVVEFSKFDSRTHQNDVTVYIVNKETDMGEFIAKCMSLELMR
jgi:hypothetical protein